MIVTPNHVRSNFKHRVIKPKATFIKTFILHAPTGCVPPSTPAGHPTGSHGNQGAVIISQRARHPLLPPVPAGAIRADTVSQRHAAHAAHAAQ